MNNSDLIRPNASRRACSVIVALLVLVSPIPDAYAQAAEQEKFSVSLGLFVTDRSSNTRFNAQGSSMDGTEVDMEEEFGLDKSDSVFRLDGYYRFNQKHSINFSWFDLSRSGVNQIRRDISWNDTVYPIDTVIDSNFDLAIYKLAYTWSFLRRDKGFLGVTGGFYIADTKTVLTERSLGRREDSAFTAPLPVIGLRGEYHFSEKWVFRASGEVFAFAYGDFDGSLFDLYAGVDYQLFNQMAIGVAINSVTMDIGVTKTNATGQLDWNYTGGLIFLKFDF